MSSLKILLGPEHFKLFFCLLSFRKVSCSFLLCWTGYKLNNPRYVFISPQAQPGTNQSWVRTCETASQNGLITALVSRRLSNFSSSWLLGFSPVKWHQLIFLLENEVCFTWIFKGSFVELWSKLAVQSQDYWLCFYYCHILNLAFLQLATLLKRCYSVLKGMNCFV